MRKSAVLILGIVFLASIAAAPGKEPSHPLSHIHPIDEDFNMSDMRIFNVSRLSVNGGLKIDGNQIMDSGANPILNYNDADRRLELRNNDFGVTGNNITSGNNVSFNNSLRVHGGKVWIPDDAEYGYFYRKNLSEVLEDGNNATIYDINMNGQDINNLDELRTDGSGSDDIAVRDTANGQDIVRFNEGGDVSVPNGILNAKNGFDSTSGNIRIRSEGAYNFYATSAKLSSRGEGLRLTTDTSPGGYVQFYDEENDQVILNGTVGGDVEIPNGNLDLNSNNITNIDTLKFEEGTSIDGNLTVNGSVNTSGDIDMNDHDIVDANNVEANEIYDPEDGSLRVNDDINMVNNNLVNPTSILLSGGNSDTTVEFGRGGATSQTFKIVDDGNALDVMRYQQGGNIEIPNGNLRNTGGNIIAGDGNSVQVRPSDGSAWYDIQDKSGDFVIQQTGDQEVLRINQNTHEVNVLNGDLDTNNNNIEDVASIDGGGNAVRVDNNVDLNGNSVTSSGGEVCIGDQCA